MIACAFEGIIMIEVRYLNFFQTAIHSSINSVSSQCARGKSSIARKPKTIPNFLSGKKLVKNVTPPDFIFYRNKLTDKYRLSQKLWLIVSN